MDEKQEEPKSEAKKDELRVVWKQFWDSDNHEFIKIPTLEWVPFPNPEQEGRQRLCKPGIANSIEKYELEEKKKKIAVDFPQKKKKKKKKKKKLCFYSAPPSICAYSRFKLRELVLVHLF